MHKAVDIEIVSKAKKEKRIILTCDLDFGYLMSVSQDIYPSIIIFKLEDFSPDNINIKLKQILNEASDALKKGAIISVEETRFRVRLMPIL